MTRTFKAIYPQIYDLDTLWKAWRKARRGGKRRWPSVAAFEFDLEANLLALHEDLRDKRYAPGPYRNFTIREPKVRRISAAPFRDRVVHHALMQATWPIFEKRMIHDSRRLKSASDKPKSVLKHTCLRPASAGLSLAAWGFNPSDTGRSCTFQRRCIILSSGPG